MLNEKINLLNDMQKEAVLKKDGPILILAGAGSGKTRVLIHRIAYIIEQGVSPFNILAITFTNKAAKEMRERLNNLIDYENQVWVSTFHSTCVRILRIEIERIGYSKNFTIYDAEDSLKVIKEIYKENNINDKNFSPKSMLNEISMQKDNLILPEKYEEENYNDIKKKNNIIVYKEYEKILRKNNALDFDDIIFKTVQLFLENPDILEKYQERFKYIMVDEYQDTNTSQYTLIKLLAQKYQNICVVGDDDQSIYGWRGANIENIFNFENDFKNAKIIKLEQNYRSTGTILNAANSVIKNNTRRKRKTLWTENDKGNLINFNRLDNEHEEARFIAKEIKDKIEKENLTYKDFAILYRNNYLSRVVEEQFVYSSIPYKLYGGINFYGRKEIKDILAYLKIIYNSDDDISLKRIINVPKRSIGNATIEKISNYANYNNISFFRAVENVEEITELGNRNKNIIEFYKFVRALKEFSLDNSVSKTIEFILEQTEYIYSIEKSEGVEEANNRKENIQELLNKAMEFENEFGENASLGTFLEEVSLVADIETDEDEFNKVTLMTLHSAKGLEFPIVFIIGFEEGIFPTFNAYLDEKQIEEERRLCYVGITRAKKELYITCSRVRVKNGRFDNNSISRFYQEISKDYLNDIAKNETKVKETEAHYRPKIKYNYNFDSYISKELLTPKNVSIDFSEGDTVKHFVFGKGKIEKIEPSGADYEITVNFGNVGVKKFMSTMVKLKKID